MVDSNQQSSVNDAIEYFNLLWDNRYSKEPNIRTNINKTNIIHDELQRYKKTVHNIHPELNSLQIDWHNISFPTQKVTFIHNPIERGNKEPWIWYDLSRLINHAEDSIFIQSPYIIPTKKMMKHIDIDHLVPEN